ncbi:uncharacterized protein [Nicotiana sylvestris]|uniref:uncharacterized protein n=1 Tax=Nicotiana sylvestris TaxID=4096 RepID=UPI00388C72D5
MGDGYRGSTTTSKRTGKILVVLTDYFTKWVEAGAFKQVREKEVRDFIWITSTPYHSVGNGQAESTNKVIINNLKKRLEESKGNWPELLPGVLWAYRTTAKTSTGETPFSLVYGAEALIQVKIGEPSMRFTQASEEYNDEEMCINLDLLEGKRETALIRMTSQKQAEMKQIVAGLKVFWRVLMERGWDVSVLAINGGISWRNGDCCGGVADGVR